MYHVANKNISCHLLVMYVILSVAIVSECYVLACLSYETFVWRVRWRKEDTEWEIIWEGLVYLKTWVVVRMCSRLIQNAGLLRPLSNNTKASSQCVNCLIFIHTVTTALSDCLYEPLHMAER